MKKKSTFNASAQHLFLMLLLCIGMAVSLDAQTTVTLSKACDCEVYNGTAAPTLATPGDAGDIYIDTTNKDMYIKQSDGSWLKITTKDGSWSTYLTNTKEGEELTQAQWKSNSISWGNSTGGQAGGTLAKDGANSAAGGTDVIVDGNNSLGVGMTNTVTANQSIVGGSLNVVAGGSNLVVGTLDTLAATALNNLAAGENNNVTNINNTVSGFSNIVNGTNSLVSGFNNKIDVFSGNVVGGAANQALGSLNVISGSGNIITSTSNIVGGLNNKILNGVSVNQGYNLFVGRSNTMDGNMVANVVGGRFHTINTLASDNLIVGSSNVITTGLTSLIGGTLNTLTTSSRGVMVGTSNTQLSGTDSYVGGELNNLALANQSIISGLSNTVVTQVDNSMMIGNGNTITAGTDNIIAGETNIVSSAAQSIFSGLTNTVLNKMDNGLLIGTLNNANNANQSIVAGTSNTLSGSNSLVIGSTNNLSGFNSSVISGTGITGTANNTAYAQDITYFGTLTNASDKRLKSNIAAPSYGLSTVMQMKPAIYNYKNETKKSIGFIAQEMQSIVPEVVDVIDSKNGYLGISYTELIPVLTKAIQEQQVQIEALKQKNATLEQTVSAFQSLAKDVENLKAMLSAGIKEAATPQSTKEK